jgi:hypothetical protein
MSFSTGESAPVMVALKEDESRLVEEIGAYLDSKTPEDGKLVRERFVCLEGLGEAVSRYPSVRETQTMRGEQRDEAKLTDALCAFSPSSHLLHIPVRVVAVRSYLVAKFQAFSFLALLVRNVEDFYAPLRRIQFSVICTLMAEEVYFSCLEDPSFPEGIKGRLAHDLVSLWDSGTDPRSVRHLSALESLWAARDAAPPSFGTMDGSSELFRISMEMEEDWQDFLISQMEEDETRWALEEFLFGLSYEEIREVRERLRRFGLTAVGFAEVHSFLGSQPAYAAVEGSDFRSIYDFYVDRRDAAHFRKRISAPGPRKTLEEIYLKYRIVME